METVPELGDPFITGPRLGTKRTNHTASLLSDGKVLVIGGSDDGGNLGNLDTTEIYDPETDAFSPGPRLGTKRANHTASLLSDGKVLVIGSGGDGGELDTTEIYDPETDAFSPGPRLGTKRFSHTASLLSDGKVLVIGGFGDALIPTDTTETFDLARFEVAAFARACFRAPIPGWVTRAGPVVVRTLGGDTHTVPALAIQPAAVAGGGGTGLAGRRQTAAWSALAAAMGLAREEIYLVSPGSPVALYRPTITVTARRAGQPEAGGVEVVLATECGPTDQATAPTTTRYALGVIRATLDQPPSSTVAVAGPGSGRHFWLAVGKARRTVGPCDLDRSLADVGLADGIEVVLHSGDASKESAEMAPAPTAPEGAAGH